MISLEQIRALEKKVTKAVELIDRLRKENKALNDTLEGSQIKIQDLEKLVQNFKGDQEEIEKTILDTIKKLERLEDEVTAAPTAGAPDKPAGRRSEGLDNDRADAPAEVPLSEEPAQPEGNPQDPPVELTKDDSEKELDIF